MLKGIATSLAAFMSRPTREELSKIDAHLSEMKSSVADLKSSIESIRYSSEVTMHHAVAQLKALKFLALGPERVVTFFYNGFTPIKFFVPKANIDHIQGHYVYHETFWEQDELDKYKDFTKNKAIVDVGANVGNHVVYWSKIAGAKSIKAFEPIPELFQIMKKNIELNQIENAEIFEMAVGKERGFGQPLSNPMNRMQSEIHTTSNAGGIQICALDEMDIQELDFLKVDVEGHTLPVLEGAVNTLQRFNPALFIELFDDEKAACDAVLNRLGYRQVKALRDSNYFYVSQHRDFAGELPA